MNVPYNTGKVKIGLAYDPIPPAQLPCTDMQQIQLALLQRQRETQVDDYIRKVAIRICFLCFLVLVFI